MSQFDLARLRTSFDYDRVFRDRTVFITGCMRSGTSFMAKTVGSFKPVYYLHEPTMLLLGPTMGLLDKTHRKQHEDLLKAVLFEDFMLQIIHSRFANFNERNLSWVGNFEDPDESRKRWELYDRRDDVLEHLFSDDVVFVVKIPGIQPLLELLAEWFPGASFIHTLRSGSDVVNSCFKRRGWFSERFIDDQLIEWVQRDSRGRKVPWFVEGDCVERFHEWNSRTQAAVFWRIQNEYGLDFCERNPDQSYCIRYEDFIQDASSRAEEIAGFLSRRTKLKVSTTEITKRHIESIKTYDYLEYEDITGELAPEEYERFMATMRRAGYGPDTMA